MNEMENIFGGVVRKVGGCGECGAITACIGGDSVVHWCCNCGAKLKGNYVYAASDIPPRVWDDEKKQYSYLKVSFKSCFDKNETTVQEEVPMPPKCHPLHKLGQRLAELLDENQWAECERLLLEGWKHEQKPSAAEVPIEYRDAKAGTEWGGEAYSAGYFDGEAAGYARGLAEGRERCAVEAWMYYMDTCKRNGIGPDVCPQWCCAAALRREVKS